MIGQVRTFCARCGKFKDPAEFPLLTGEGRRYAVCTECVRKEAQRQAAVQRALKQYTLEADDYEALLDYQDSRCAICRTPFDVTKPIVDHDHKTGDVRGLLCAVCNAGLGMFRDSRKSLSRATSYLSRPPLDQARKHLKTKRAAEYIRSVDNRKENVLA